MSECCICYEDTGKSLECHDKHRVCVICIEKINKCPQCKKKITQEFKETFSDYEDAKLIKLIDVYIKICLSLEELTDKFKRPYEYYPATTTTEQQYTTKEKIEQLNITIPLLNLKHSIQIALIQIKRLNKLYQHDFDINKYYTKEELEEEETKYKNYFQYQFNIYQGHKLAYLQGNNKPIVMHYDNFLRTTGHKYQKIVSNTSSEMFAIPKLPQKLYTCVIDNDTKYKILIKAIDLYINGNMVRIECLNKDRVELDMIDIIREVFKHSQDNPIEEYKKKGHCNMHIMIRYDLTNIISKDIEINILPIVCTEFDRTNLII